MSTVLKSEPVNNLLITKDRVKGWEACASGYRWFLEKFPESGECADVYKALIADKRGDDADWLIGKIGDELETVERVKLLTVIAGADAVAIAKAVSDGANAATTGYWANAATTGEGANAATTGYRANAATTGEGANAATTGNWANAATTGYRANAATTGDWANAATTGEHAVAAALGIEAKAKASTGGAIMLVHRNDDGHLLHVFASKVGENGLKPDVWYLLDESGKPQETTI